MHRSTVIYLATVVSVVIALAISRGCSAGAWSVKGSVGLAVGVLGGTTIVLTADNTHGVWLAYWSDTKRGLPDVAITARGTQVSPDGRKVQFYPVELSK